MIGILTFHCTDNYGAVLQAYALKEVLSNQFPNYEAAVVDYKCKETITETKLRSMIRNKGLRHTLLHYLSIKLTNIKFERFRKNNLNLTNEYYSSDELQVDADKFEFFISGSDQVWNLVWSGNDEIYFQTFNQNRDKRISYAASFGFERLNDDLADFYRNSLAQFKGISVREESAKQIVEQQLGLVAERHIDPTLLLDRKQWATIGVKPKTDKYILVYMVPKQDSVIDFAIDLGKKTGLQVILLSQSLTPFGVCHIRSASPEEFVGWIANAQYVVTNSFHGTAFSIIFHKKFFLELNNLRGLNVRSRDLLELCSIPYKNEGSIVAVDMDNWESVDHRLRQEQLYSQDYFRRMIQ